MEVRVGRRHLGHVRPVHDEGQLVVADWTPELLCHVVLAQRVLERDVDLEGLRKKKRIGTSVFWRLFFIIKNAF